MKILEKKQFQDILGSWAAITWIKVVKYDVKDIENIIYKLSIFDLGEYTYLITNSQ